MEETIGERIRTLRQIKTEEENKRCTQADLGKAMGVTSDQIRKWEKNEILLNAEKIVDLADYFNVSCDYLLRGGEKEHLTLINKTGLSDESIETLEKSYNDLLDPGYSIIALNAIISDKNFLSLLGQYFCNDFDSVSYIKGGQQHQVSIEWLGAFDSFLAESSLEPVARTVISDHLKKIREEIRRKNTNGEH